MFLNLTWTIKKLFINFQITEKYIIQWTRKELGQFKTLWGGVKFLDKIPKTSSGKIARKEINEMAKAYKINRNKETFKK